MKSLQQAKKLYFVGIKGAGMTALAQILKGWGKKVSGSDVRSVFFTDEVLKKNKIKIFSPFKASNVSQADLVIYSTAYNAKNNIEIKTALKKKLPLLSYPQAVGQLFDQKIGLAVCGTHGKTTTSAMLTFVMKELNLSPTALIGSAVPQFGGGAVVGTSQYVVVEADEYQNKLKYYHPQIVILTSADFDHPDYFKNQTAYNKVFTDFIKKISDDGLLIAFALDKNVQKIKRGAKCQVVTYSDKYKLKLKLPGRHNQYNANAVMTLAEQFGWPLDKVQRALQKFAGTKRRFELLGQKRRIKVYDDYAHHPTEIRAALQAAREKFPRQKIWLAFQSHTYTRTKSLLPDFAQSFKLADQVVVLDIFGSAREKQGGIDAPKLAAAINRVSHNASYRGDFSAVVDYLAKQVKPGDVVLTMGAGENWQVGVKLLKKL